MRLTIIWSGLLGMLTLAAAGRANAAGTYWDVSYEPSPEPAELQLGVSYTLWLPDQVKKVRALIVHQHGCGVGACQGGATAAYDLHWQALAKKWDCGLLGPSYRQAKEQSCRLWCDPRAGSQKAFLKALDDLAKKSNHPELARAPWCLWGHSGGGFWASLMQTLYPQRIVAVWCRSGTAFAYWQRGEIPTPDLPEAVYGIPVVCNPGVKENDHERFRAAWDGAWAMFEAYRAKKALIAFAPDPRTSHECGDSRYLAIPFFDACLGLRLPDKQKTGAPLRPIDLRAGWLAVPLSSKAEPADCFQGKVEQSVWLPNRQVAEAWSEYVRIGYVTDRSPPPAPRCVRVAADAAGCVAITWETEADLESGLTAFEIERDGQPLLRVPEKPIARFGRPLFQPMSYHDTPEKPLPDMRCVDPAPQPGKKHTYRVIAVNSSDLRSAPSTPATLP